MYSSQASVEASSLITEFLKHRKEDAGPHPISNDIAAAQVCALLSIAHEIGQLAAETKEISLAIIAHSKAIDALAHAVEDRP